MPDSRRGFLKAVLLAALFAAVPLKNVLGQSWGDRDGNPGGGSSSAQDDPLANYTKATFIYYLNSVFQLRTGFGVVAVTLLKVDDMAPPKGGECFSLLFRGGGGPALPQGTYTVEHPSLGRFQLFLVPAGTDSNGVQGYLATINRLSYDDVLLAAPGGSPAKRAWVIKMEDSSAPTNTSPLPTSPGLSTTPATSPEPTNPANTEPPSQTRKRPAKRKLPRKNRGDLPQRPWFDQ